MKVVIQQKGKSISRMTRMEDLILDDRALLTLGIARKVIWALQDEGLIGHMKGPYIGISNYKAYISFARRQEDETPSSITIDGRELEFDRAYILEPGPDQTHTLQIGEICLIIEVLNS